MILNADVDNKTIFPTNQKLCYLEFAVPGINTKTSQISFVTYFK